MSQEKLLTALKELEALHPTTMDFGRERFRAVFQKMEEQYALTPIAPLLITVAGTNGKGSTATTTASLFQAHGKKVGLFTSPHIDRFNERIRINGVEASDEAILEAFAAIDEARKTITLTYFEVATLAAFYLFHKESVDVAILEVGLGGRLDCTNIVDANIAIITPIGLDHTHILGETIDEIAAEKGGIIKEHAIAISSEAVPNLAIRERAEAMKAQHIVAQRDYLYGLIDDDSTGSWRYQFRGAKALSLRAPNLKGAHQYQNAAAAITALYAANIEIDETLVNRGLEAVTLMGRFQRLSSPNGPTLYLDVTHNPQGAEKLAEALKEVKKESLADGATPKVWAIYGALTDKDAPTVASLLESEIDHWLTVPIEGERGGDAKTLQERITPLLTTPVEAMQSLEDACEKALRLASKDDIIILFGSFYLISKGYGWFTQHDYQ